MDLREVYEPDVSSVIRGCGQCRPYHIETDYQTESLKEVDFFPLREAPCLQPYITSLHCCVHGVLDLVDTVVSLLCGPEGWFRR